MIFFILFLILTSVILLIPQITIWDKEIIVFFQLHLKGFPLELPLLLDCSAYILMVVLPILILGVYFFRKKLYFNILHFALLPFGTFVINYIIKHVIKRPRPPFELQQVIHPDSFSYVSSHTLVMAVLLGAAIFYTFKYCSNKMLKYIITICCIFLILFTGLSRIWLGVHYLTDVIGAYLLACVILNLYIKLTSAEGKGE